VLPPVGRSAKCINLAQSGNLRGDVSIETRRTQVFSKDSPSWGQNPGPKTRGLGLLFQPLEDLSQGAFKTMAQVELRKGWNKKADVT